MSLSTRKDNRYRITIEEISSDADIPKTLQFELQDREDLFNVVENLNKGSGLEVSLATKVAVGIRLLGPVMMQQRKHPLFVDFMPHFKTFMQHLKGTVKNALTQQ